MSKPVHSTESLKMGDKLTVTGDGGREYDMTVSRIYTDPTIAQQNARTVIAHLRPGGYSVTIRNDTIAAQKVVRRDIRRVTVSVEVDVDVDAYALDYGRTDDYAEYTADLVKASAAQRFEALGWGTVDGAPDL